MSTADLTCKEYKRSSSEKRKLHQKFRSTWRKKSIKEEINESKVKKIKIKNKNTDSKWLGWIVESHIEEHLASWIVLLVQLSLTHLKQV